MLYMDVGSIKEEEHEGERTAMPSALIPTFPRKLLGCTFVPPAICARSQHHNITAGSAWLSASGFRKYSYHHIVHYSLLYFGRASSRTGQSNTVSSTMHPAISAIQPSPQRPRTGMQRFMHISTIKRASSLFLFRIYHWLRCWVRLSESLNYLVNCGSNAWLFVTYNIQLSRLSKARGIDTARCAKHLTTPVRAHQPSPAPLIAESYYQLFQRCLDCTMDLVPVRRRLR